MQFRPVGVERPDEELAPKGPEFAEHAGFAFPAVRSGWKGILT